MNRFDKCESIDEVITQAVGYGSTCWTDLGSPGEYDAEAAAKIAGEAFEQVQRLAFSPSAIQEAQFMAVWRMSQ